MKQRHGIAIITVVLLSALILIAITIVSAQAIAEKTITVSQSGFKRALSVAEAGLTQTITDLRNATWTGSNLTMPDGSALAYLNKDEITGLVTGLPGTTVVDMREKYWPDATGSSTFWVKVRKVSDPNLNVNLPWTARDMIVGVYVMGQVYNNAQLIARRVLYAQYTVTLGATTSSDLFKYGLLSGGAMNFGGSAMVYGGDIRSNGVIDFGSQYRLADAPKSPDSDYDYKVYTGHGITGNKNVTDDASQYVVKPGGDFVFPAIDLTHYRTMAGDFKGGTGFYNGTGDPTDSSTVYPNTLNATVKELIVADLGTVGTPSTFAQVTTFYDHIANRTGGIPSVPLGWKSVSDAVYNQILSNLPRATYYIKQSAQIAGGSAEGTVVFDCPAGGGVTFTGGTLNTEGNYGLALLVNGDLTINGNTIIYGGVYATGKIQKMNGDFTVYGSIATQGAMDNLQGNFSVYYHAISGISPIYTTSGVIAAVEPLNADQNGSWREKDLVAFTNAP